MDSSLLSNIQKLFYERIEVFATVEFYKLSIVTGIIKIVLKVYCMQLKHSHCITSYLTRGKKSPTVPSSIQLCFT